MTAADTAPPIRLDRYLALLAILLALVLALLVIGERQKAPAAPPLVVGSLPPPPDPRVAALVAEREGLLAEQARLAEALAATRAALAEAESRADALARENERLRQLLGDEGAALDDLARRLAAAESERDRLSAQLDALNRSRGELETRIAELEAAGSLPAPAAVPGSSTGLSTTLPTEPSTRPSPPLEALAGPGRDPDAPAAPAPDVVPGEPLDLPAPSASGIDPGDIDPGEIGPGDRGTAGAVTGPPRRLTTFVAGGTVDDGVAAYNSSDFATAERIWARLADAGDRRAQFYFGAMLFEGRTAPPDRVMAHVWLSRSVDAGYLPAIEVRRQVRAAMTEAEYERALAIQAGE